MNVGLGFLSVPLFWITQQFGWRGLFLIVGALGVVFGAACGGRSIATRARARRSTAPNSTTSRPAAAANTRAAAATSSGATSAALLQHRQVIGASIGQFGGNSTLVFFLTWFPTYLVTARGMTFIKAGLMTSLPYIGASIGVLLGGLGLRHAPEAHRIGQPGAQAADRRRACCWRRRSSSPTTSRPTTTRWSSLIMSIAFFGQGMTNLGWTVVSDIAPKKLIGLTGGLFNFSANLAGIVTPIVIGDAFEATGSFVGPLVYIARRRADRRVRLQRHPRRHPSPRRGDRLRYAPVESRAVRRDHAGRSGPHAREGRRQVGDASSSIASLASVTFRQVDRLKRFLSFIVSEALAGPRRSAQGIRDRRPGLRQGLVVRSARRSDRPRAGAAAAGAAGALLPRGRRRRRDRDRAAEGRLRAGLQERARRAAPGRRSIGATLVGQNTIAVLPLADHSPAHDLAYFCDGLRQEIIHGLAKLEALRVLAVRARRRRSGRPTTTPDAPRWC